MRDHFDEMLHTFTCQNAECGHRFTEALRRLLKLDKVACPKCRTPIDIRESKRTGQIGRDFDAASELNKKIGKKQ